MKIDSIELSGFRNYETLKLEFGPGVHIFYGDNAQGKSNLLEAIYYAATGKSYRGSRDREIIAFSAEEAHIKAFFEARETTYRVDMHLKKGRNKGVAVNSVPIRKMKEFAGLFGAVVFSPEDLQIVKEGPDVRRRFIDNELSMTDPYYFNAFTQYKKALEQRNKLLKELPDRPALLDTLDAWDQSLVRYGKELIQGREAFAEVIRPIVRKTHEHLTGTKESLEVFYEKNTEAEAFERELQAARSRDMKALTTTVGPHRDDLRFELTTDRDGKKETVDARIFASQGQQRTAALALKLSEIEFLKAKTGENPILLLDDVFSELDSRRQQYLVENMQTLQTFITCTGLEEFVGRQETIGPVFRIANGVVTNG